MTLEEDFEKATDDAKHLVTKSKQKELLHLYGLFKLVKFGKNDARRPSILNFTGLEKWKAWTKASILTKDEAMEEYVALVKKLLDNEI